MGRRAVVERKLSCLNSSPDVSRPKYRVRVHEQGLSWSLQLHSSHFVLSVAGLKGCPRAEGRYSGRVGEHQEGGAFSGRTGGAENDTCTGSLRSLDGKGREGVSTDEDAILVQLRDGTEVAFVFFLGLGLGLET